MLIDWFTVVAQVINFLVLVWLLQRFLYKPILMAMQRREETVASQLRDAEKQKADAEAEATKFRTAHDEFEQRRQQLLREAEDGAETLRQRLKEEARKEIETTRGKWQQALRDEQGAFRAELAGGVRKEVFSIARSALADLGGIDVEGQIAATFIRRLETLNDEERSKLNSILTGARQPAVVRSAFELSPAVREAIEEAVGDLSPTQSHAGMQYEVTPDLVGGIELAADGRKVSWSIDDYLSSLEQRVQRLTAERAKKNGDVE